MAQTYNQLSDPNKVRVNAVLLNAFTEAFDETTLTLDADPTASVEGLDFAVLRRAIRVASKGGENGFAVLRDSFRDQLAAQIESLPPVMKNGKAESTDLAQQNMLFSLYEGQFAADKSLNYSATDYVDIPDRVLGKDSQPYPFPELGELKAGDQMFPPTVGSLIRDHKGFTASQREFLYPPAYGNDLPFDLIPQPKLVEPVPEPLRRYEEFAALLQKAGAEWNKEYDVPEAVMDKLSKKLGPSGKVAVADLFEENLRGLKEMVRSPEKMEVLAKRIEQALAQDPKQHGNEWLHHKFQELKGKPWEQFYTGVISKFVDIVNRYENDIHKLRTEGERDTGTIWSIESLNLVLMDQMGIQLPHKTEELTYHRGTVDGQYKERLKGAVEGYKLDKMEELMGQTRRDQRVNLETGNGLPVNLAANKPDKGSQIV